MLFFCRSSSRALLKVVSRFNQGPQTSPIMGTSYTKSYSPNVENQHSDNSAATAGTITKVNSETKYVESVVCKADDMNDNEMKVLNVGEGEVLLVKQNGEFSAVGTKCTHYGAPLVNGALGNGRIRCPWHGACFSLRTGDIEDFPGFDSLPCYQVTVTKKGEVKVRADVEDLKSNVRIKPLKQAVCRCDTPRAVIVGGGPSGATCAETLRSEGFDGHITIVAKEPYLPYDRIKVSKLDTIVEIEKLQARTQEYYNNANIEVIKGVEATKVDTKLKNVHLSDGNKLPYTTLYLATGSKPNVPSIPGVELQNVFTVRNFDDSVNILNTLEGRKHDEKDEQDEKDERDQQDQDHEEKKKNVVVLGLSFIALEMAAVCVSKAKSVTVVGKNEAPLDHIFGLEIGTRLKELFEAKKINFIFGTTIKSIRGESGIITSVELANAGKPVILPADMLILGVGTTFNTDFLRDSDIVLTQNGAVEVNYKLQTNVENVYAGGDIAFAPVFAAGEKHMSIGHVGLSQYHGRIAAMNMVKKHTFLRTVPYFWTTVFGKSIRYAGCGTPASTQVVGDLKALKFVLFSFDENDKVISVASCMRDPVVSQFAELLYQGKTLYKKDLEEDPFAWTNNIH